MTEINRKRRRALPIIVTIVIIGILFFLLRGPYLSNSIKRVIIPVLENATQERVLIDKAVINLFPFYIQAKGFKVFDREGNRLLWVTKTRVYIDLLGLLSREIRIRSITLKEPDITASAGDLKRIQENLEKAQSGADNGNYRINVTNIKISDGNFVLRGLERFTSVSGKGIFAEIRSRTNIRVRLSVNEGSLVPSGLNEIDYKIDGNVKIHDRKIDITGLNIKSGHSSADFKGALNLSPDNSIKDGHLLGKARIYIATLDELFEFQQKRDGVLSFDGSVNLASHKDSKWPVFTLDLETDSQFYLETLMEIIKVEETISGKISLNGTIKGKLPELTGQGRATLEKALFTTLPIDDLEGNIFYENSRFSLKDFAAQVYQGEMHGDANIMIPHGDYSVDARIKDVDSEAFFRFITWEPPFPEGRISGDLALKYEHDREMEIIADVDYVNTSQSDGNVIDRLETIHAALEMKNGVLELQGSVLSTAETDLFIEGDINLDQDTLSLQLQLETSNALDLTAPYYKEFSAPLSFHGMAEGSTSEPAISGRIEAAIGKIYNIDFSDAYADITYRIDKLHVNRMVINHEDEMVDASGSVDFRKADALFSFKDPVYTGQATLKNVEIEPIIARTYKQIPVSGLANGVLSFKGDAGVISAEGDLTLSDSMIYGETLESISVKTSLYPDRIEFRNVKARKGRSELSAQGILHFNRVFSFDMSSGNLYLDDFDIVRDYPFNAQLTAQVAGSGKIDNPDINFEINVLNSSFKGGSVGTGNIKGDIHGKKMTAEGNLADGIVSFKADGLISEENIWDVGVDFHRGRYDFLLAGFLDEVPRDLSVSLAGRTILKTKGRDISIYSDFKALEMSLYGYSLKNSGDVILEMVDNEVNIKSFRLSGHNADFFADGSVKLNDRYNVKLEGSLDISPLRAIHSSLSSTKGLGSFFLDIKGGWSNPEITGEVTLENGIVQFDDFPHKIGPVNGSFHIKRDRINFDSIESSFAGGKVILSGAGYLDGLKINRIYISSDLSGIRIKPIDKVIAFVDGKLFYEISPERSSLAGDLDIERASYTKNVEFGSLLMGIKEINVSTSEYPEFFRNTELNINVSGSKDIVIDNNIAETDVKVDVNITGTPEQYGLIGRVEPLEGNIYFRSNEFNILRGTVVEFIEPNSVQPVFHILADTYKSDYYVKLTLDGTMEEFSLTLFSDPPLPEMDILALLTLGHVQQEEGGIESGMGAGEAATILAGGFQELIQEEFHDVTGLERFQVEPHTTRAGAFSPKVTVGKRLLEDRLLVIYSTPVGTTEENVIKLKYILNKNVSVVGWRNEIGSTGADLTYRFEFK
jgi:translocation and assembly module TamB